MKDNIIILRDVPKYTIDSLLGYNIHGNTMYMIMKLASKILGQPVDIIFH